MKKRLLGWAAFFAFCVLTGTAIAIINELVHRRHGLALAYLFDHPQIAADADHVFFILDSPSLYALAWAFALGLVAGMALTVIGALITGFITEKKNGRFDTQPRALPQGRRDG